MSQTISVIVPCYNEAKGVATFHGRLAAVLARTGLDWEVVYVNDGSRDETLTALLALHKTDDRVNVVNLSRNFGKEIAMTAGLDAAAGDLVVVIDADLQDPPEVIEELLAEQAKGFDVVYAQRRARHGDSWLKKSTAEGFYRLMQNVGDVRLPANTGDFRLMTRPAVDALLQLRERHRFMKGLFAWIGFPSSAVLYDRDPRFAGKTSFNYWKLWNFAIEGITSHTVAPLKIATYLGVFIAVVAVVYGTVIVVRTLALGNPVPGYPSLITVTLFLGGAQLMTLGVMGEYLGRVFNETKSRPLYLTQMVYPSRLSWGGGPVQRDTLAAPIRKSGAENCPG